MVVDGCRPALKDLAVYGTLLAAMAAGAATAFYLYTNAPQWEAPATLLSLGLGLAAAVWYLRTKRHRWLVGICSAVLLVFGVASVVPSAILNGWQAALIAVALIEVGLGALIALSFVLLYRWRRGIESTMREVGEDLYGDPRFRGIILFRDDGERITVYPKRGSLLLQCACLALTLAVTVGAAEFMKMDDVVKEIEWVCALGLLAGLVMFRFVPTLYRLLLRRPTLIVGPDGITDHGSLIGTGMGMIHWDEILAVNTFTRATGWIRQHYLSIVVTDAPAIRGRRPLWARAAPLLFHTVPSMLLIWQGVLDAPAGEVTARIARYIKTHAPPDWRGVRDGGVGDERPPPPTE